MIHIMCKRGSESARVLSEKTGFRRVYWQTKAGKPAPEITGIINWGVYGDIRTNIRLKYPELFRRKVLLNSRWPGDKYSVVKLAEEKEIPVKPTTRQIDNIHAEDVPWIYKGYTSAGGKQVERITLENLNQMDWTKGYAQQEVTNRKYEVRVSAFRWLPRSKWGVWKKTSDNPEQLAWNHHQGGKFKRIQRPEDYPLFQRCMDHAANIINITGLDFGAVDFIVGPDWKEYFLEVNTQPGFTEDYGAELYADAFKALENLEPRQWKLWYLNAEPDPEPFEPNPRIQPIIDDDHPMIKVFKEYVNMCLHHDIQVDQLKAALEDL